MRALLDRTDLAILERLQEDGRMPFAALGRELGLAEATVRHRVNRLVRKGLVQIIAVADPLKLGLQLAEVGIRLRGPVGDAVRALERIPEVDYIAICTGSFDLLIEVVYDGPEHLLRVLSDGIRRAPGVDQVEVFTILQVPKDSYRYMALESASGLTESGRNPARA
ncbi:Leucine-responsive regulatory protein [bacterium HR12]|nr:Leucine-responsive regulatory protein [bacterium HR12]